MSRHPSSKPAGLRRIHKLQRNMQARISRFVSESLERRQLLTALSWSAGPSLPAPRADAAVVSSVYGLLLFDGSTATGTTSSVLQLGPYNTAWASASQTDQSVSGLGAGETGQRGPIVNGQYKYQADIFVFGGASGGGTPTSTVTNYNYPESDTASAPSMSTVRSAFAYVTDPATGDLYAIGGLGSSKTPLASGEFYDENADAWTAIAPLPQPVYGGAGVADGAGHLFVIGGDSSAGQPLNTVYRYTIATNTWDTMSAMPMALTRTAAVDAAYGMVYVIGGLSASGAVANVEVYNPVTDSWSDEAPLPSPVYGASAAIDQNGNVDVIGGHNAAGAPVANVWTSPVGPAPVGLPVPPTLSVDTYTVYDGAPQPVVATAVGTDGVTPVAGSFTSITYNGSTTVPTAAGTYKVVAVFTSADPNYVSSAVDGTLEIAQATPTIALTGGGTFTYNGQPHAVTATEVGIDGQTPVPGSFTITYNGSTTAPINGGSYSVVASFTSSDPNYTSATATTAITIPDPTIPTGVAVAGASTTSITISWNACPVPVSGYNVYQRHVAHSPKGSGATIYYSLIATTQGTSITLSTSGGTFAVASVSPTGVVSTRSADASGTTLYAPSLYGVITSGGALVSTITGCEVGTTVTATIDAYGNQYPTFTMLSGPSTMSVNPTTGVITYLPVVSDMGSVSATFQATNSIGSATETVGFQVIGLPTVQVTGGTFDFDGNTHSATAVAYAINGVTPLAGSFTFTYSPVQYPQAVSTSPYAEPGTYIVHATFVSSDPVYGGASGTGMLTILPAVPGTADDDLITLVRDADGQHIDWSMGNLSDQVSIADANGIIINGNGGNDTINLDYSNGNPLPNVLHLNGTFTINGLSGSNPLTNTNLDIGDSTIYISYADPSTDPLPLIQQYLQTGYNNGLWTGTPTSTTGVITSTAAASNASHSTGIGYADSAEAIGVNATPDTIELKYTLYGDTGLTGSVGFTDFMRMTQNSLLSSGATWSEGDFNYDGAVNSADFSLLQPNSGRCSAGDDDPSAARPDSSTAGGTAGDAAEHAGCFDITDGRRYRDKVKKPGRQGASAQKS
jgi:hypothetical protein